MPDTATVTITTHHQLSTSHAAIRANGLRIVFKWWIIRIWIWIWIHYYDYDCECAVCLLVENLSSVTCLVVAGKLWNIAPICIYSFRALCVWLEWCVCLLLVFCWCFAWLADYLGLQTHRRISGLLQSLWINLCKIGTAFLCQVSNGPRGLATEGRSRDCVHYGIECRFSCNVTSAFSPSLLYNAWLLKSD